MKIKTALQFGLCCIFLSHPIKFRIVYANNIKNLNKKERLRKISELCLSNSVNLLDVLKILQRLNIKSFRINSKFFPLYTHPDFSYKLTDLTDYEEIIKTLSKVKKYAKDNQIRLSFHPDQFIIISSPHQKVIENSIAELEYHTLLAGLVGAEVINIHIGGKYESKSETIKRFSKNFKKLSPQTQKILTVENDDVIYTPADVNELSSIIGIPFVYDIHHHRCNPDNLTEEKATELCLQSWQKFRPHQKPYFHISSSKNGARAHADYINPDDIPEFWHQIQATVDVEAKAKELAVIKLMKNFD